MNVEQMINECYLPNRRQLAPSTEAGYDSAIKAHILPRWRDTEVDTLTVFALEEWLFTKTGGCARKVWATFRVILRSCYDWGYINNDVGKRRVRLPKKEPYTAPTLTQRQYKKLIKGFYGDPLEAIVIIIASLGLRRGEAFGLRWGKDIDLKTGRVKIRRSLQEVGGEIIELPTKTAKSTRTVYLPAHAIKRLREITGKRGERVIGDMTPSEVSRKYKAACKRLKLPYIPLSNFRNTFGTLLAKSGIEMSTTANILGHSNISTTYKYYIIRQEATIKAAANTFNKAIWGHK